MPNVFHRYSPIAPDGFEHGSPEDKQKKLQALFAALTPQQMVSDGKAYVDFLLAQKGVKQGKLGAVGYCFTGQMAVRLAAAMPDKVAAAASFHGGFLVTPAPDSPHRILGPIKARLYFGHAVEDQSATPEQIKTLESALRDWHGAFQSEVYEGAKHGWTVPGRDVYNEMQAERAFEKLVELFEATLE
jgi:carboxymethylenebutenolidase